MSKSGSTHSSVLNETQQRQLHRERKRFTPAEVSVIVLVNNSIMLLGRPFGWNLAEDTEELSTRMAALHLVLLPRISLGEKSHKNTANPH